MEREEAAGQAVPTPGPNLRFDFEAFWKHHYRHYLKELMAIRASTEDAHDTIHDVIVRMLEKNTWAGEEPQGVGSQAVLHTYYDQRSGGARPGDRKARDNGATSMMARTSGRTGSG